MINFCVICTDVDLAQRVASGLRDAGATRVEVLADAGSIKGMSKGAQHDRHVFIVQTPQDKLLAALPAERSDESFAEDLSGWHEKASALLSAYEARRASSILVTHHAVGHDVGALVQRINQKWRQRLDPRVTSQGDRGQTPIPESEAAAGGTHPDPLIGYLATGLVEQTPQLQQMQARIERETGQTPTSFPVFGAMQSFREGRQSQAQRLAELERLGQTLQAELEALQQRNQDLEAQLKDATEEGELILLQLHQVQEELEHYFLKFKDAENRHEMLSHRWRQMLNRYPDHVDYEWVGVQPSQDGQSLRWHVRGLESAGVSREELIFETFMEAGVLGVRFRQTPEGVSSEERVHAGEVQQPLPAHCLTRWPQVAAHLQSVECIPAGQGEAKILRAGVLRALSASDWALVKLIPKLVIQALHERPPEAADGKPLDVGQIQAAADRLQQALHRLPHTLRYDGLTLKNHQTNPDYEHLWMVFENLAFGERRWPSFELRLGASNIQGSKFSQHPKIEIPLIGGQTKPFEGWFEESVDDFGGKWELRFDLKKQILDAGVWNGLSVDEQTLIKALLAECVQGGALQELESGLKRGSRTPWEKAFDQCLALLG